MPFGRELGVRYVLEGSVRKAGNRILSLAILSAFVDAIRTTSPASKSSVPAVPLALGGFYERVCCDDFS
jgi:TolB-like protein